MEKVECMGKGAYSSFSVGHDLVALQLLAFEFCLQSDLGCSQTEVLDVQRRNMSIELLNLETETAILPEEIGQVMIGGIRRRRRLGGKHCKPRTS